MSAYSTAALALHGAAGTDAAGSAVTLSVLGHYAMDESGGATATDGMGARNGTYVNTPSRASAGPLLPETATGYARTLARASSQYVTIGDAADFINAINTNGLTVIAWVKLTDTSGTSPDTLFSFGRVNGGNFDSLNIGYNANVNTNVAGVSAGESSLSVTLWNGATFANQYAKSYGSSDLRWAGGDWHQVAVYVSGISNAARVIEVYRDTILQTATSAATVGTTAALSSATAATAGFGVQIQNASPQANTYFNGTIGHITLVKGKPTAAQMRALFLAASDSIYGLPVRHARYSASASGYKDDGFIVAATTNNDNILAVKDLSGAGNHMLSMTAGQVPTYQNDLGLPSWDFDNFYLDGGPADSPTARQQRLTSGNASSPMLPLHIGVIIVCRPLAGSIQGITQQHVGGIYDSTSNARGVCTIPNAGASGDSELSHGYNGTNIVGTGSASTWKKLTSLPSAAIIGFTVGSDGLQGLNSHPRLFFNRWKSATTGNVPTGAPLSTNISIGGAALAGDNMFAGRVEYMIVTTPFTDAEFDAFAAAYMASIGESLNPRYHVTLVGTSIDSLNGASLNRNPLERLPVIARQRCSFRNLAYNSGRVNGSIEVDYTERTVSSAKSWDGGSSCVEWLLTGGPVNDANDSTDLTTVVAAGYTTLFADARTGGADKIACMTSPFPNGGASRGATINAALAARVGVAPGSGGIDKLITLRDLTGKLQSDALHVLPSGAQQMSEDIWSQWLLSSVVGGHAPAGAVLCRSSGGRRR